MPSCEKCWEISNGNHQEYSRLIEINHCSPEEQAGKYAGICQICKRKTIHQHCHICMNTSCKTNSSRFFYNHKKADEKQTNGTVINVNCSKCNYKHSYKVPYGYKGRIKECPKCKYQDPRK